MTGDLAVDEAIAALMALAVEFAAADAVFGARFVT
jgi:hypothetical protein